MLSMTSADTNEDTLLLPDELALQKVISAKNWEGMLRFGYKMIATLSLSVSSFDEKAFFLITLAKPDTPVTYITMAWSALRAHKSI